MGTEFHSPLPWTPNSDEMGAAQAEHDESEVHPGSWADSTVRASIGAQGAGGQVSRAATARVGWTLSPQEKPEQHKSKGPNLQLGQERGLAGFVLCNILPKGKAASSSLSIPACPKSTGPDSEHSCWHWASGNPSPYKPDWVGKTAETAGEVRKDVAALVGMVYRIRSWIQCQRFWLW